MLRHNLKQKNCGPQIGKSSAYQIQQKVKPEDRGRAILCNVIFQLSETF
jgi:hypothetical protein